MGNWVFGPGASSGGAGAVTTVAGRTGDVVIAESDVTNLTTDLAAKAALAGPTFTGVVTLPTGTVATTQSAADNSTKLGTTAYIDTAGALKANLAGPTFTGVVSLPTGTVATTQATSDSSTKIATTAYAKAQLPLSPDRMPAIVSIGGEAATQASAQPCGITALKPIFVPIEAYGVPSFAVSALSLRVNTLFAASTVGLAIYSATYASSAHVSASLVAQLNATISGAAAGALSGDVTTGSAGSGAAVATLDFTTTRYLLGMMASDVSTLKLLGVSLTAAYTGRGILSWTGTARSSATDWPASFTEAANVAALSTTTTISLVDLLTATGKFYL